MSGVRMSRELVLPLEQDDPGDSPGEASARCGPRRGRNALRGAGESGNLGGTETAPQGVTTGKRGGR